MQLQNEQKKKREDKRKTFERIVFPSGWLTIPDWGLILFKYIDLLSIVWKTGKRKNRLLVQNGKIKNYQKNKSHQNYCEFFRFIFLLSTWSLFETLRFNADSNETIYSFHFVLLLLSYFFCVVNVTVIYVFQLNEMR